VPEIKVARRGLKEVSKEGQLLECRRRITDGKKQQNDDDEHAPGSDNRHNPLTDHRPVVL